MAWRQKLTEQLPAKAVDAIERSVSDDRDVHKAAGTGIALLKGLRILDSDAPTTNVFLTSINALPVDWQSEYFDIPPTPTGSGQAGLVGDNDMQNTLSVTKQTDEHAT